MSDLPHDPAGPQVTLPVQLLNSKVWRALSITGHRIMAVLLAEYALRLGVTNGSLRATYKMLVEAGCTLELIPAALDELEAYRLLTCLRGGKGRRRPGTCRLLIFPANGAPAVHDWAAVSDEIIAQMSPRRRTKRKGQSDAK